jgi:tRNA pseudouridine32 synthase/23S rRNA pseudouridine746 synthase
VNAAPLAATPRVLHLDAVCVVVDKPSGLLSVPGRGPDKQDCLAQRVQAIWPEARVVHRLDMGTSGLWLMARGLDMQRAFSRAFEQHTVDKRYVAVVAGRVAPPQTADGWGEINLPLAADWPRRPLQKIDPVQGRPSLTRWRVLQADDDRTRLELAPLTGRTHQLRVHLQAIGHPILGDALYAPPLVQAMAPRLLLHACALALAHPTRDEVLSLRCDPPF